MPAGNLGMRKDRTVAIATRCQLPDRASSPEMNADCAEGMIPRQRMASESHKRRGSANPADRRRTPGDSTCGNSLMKPVEFHRAGHWPTLLAAFVYFDVSFMVWVLLGAIGNALAADFGLSAMQKGLIVALPLLGGALLRVVMGILTDRIGARRAAVCGLLVTIVALLLGWLWASRFEHLLLVGLLLGVAGTSFAAALPLASRWYPPCYQGLALGLAAAGNSGTAVAAFLAPWLADSWGWHRVFALAIVPIAGALALLLLGAREAPGQPAKRTLRAYAASLRSPDAWWFCVFYAVTFGGFVGLASFLSIFFHDQFGLSATEAGKFAALCVMAGSLVRPLGGYLADRYGGIRVLLLLFGAVASVIGCITLLPSLGWSTAFLVAGMVLLGLGNGAVFQLVPQRFPGELGVVTGVIGAAGAIGGFVLPNLLGGLRDLTGSFAGGFLIFSLTALTCSVILSALSETWEGAFVGRGGLAADSA
jgi:MFS transporter, NNP family, nitrate/nitrite transporter